MPIREHGRYVSWRNVAGARFCNSGDERERAKRRGAIRNCPAAARGDSKEGSGQEEGPPETGARCHHLSGSGRAAGAAGPTRSDSYVYACERQHSAIGNRSWSFARDRAGHAADCNHRVEAAHSGAEPHHRRSGAAHRPWHFGNLRLYLHQFSDGLSVRINLATHTAAS